MNSEIAAYNNGLSNEEILICDRLMQLLNECLPEAESKIWHRHPVWFLDGNPVAGYSKLKEGIRLFFWSGKSFGEEGLNDTKSKFQDSSILYTDSDQLVEQDLIRWIGKSRDIQWDYKNLVKRKGVLVRLK